MRFFYATIAALGWALLSAELGLTLNDNVMYLALAIIIAGALAGGD